MWGISIEQAKKIIGNIFLVLKVTTFIVSIVTHNVNYLYPEIIYCVYTGFYMSRVTIYPNRDFCSSFTPGLKSSLICFLEAGDTWYTPLATRNIHARYSPPSRSTRYSLQQLILLRPRKAESRVNKSKTERKPSVFSFTDRTTFIMDYLFIQVEIAFFTFAPEGLGLYRVSSSLLLSYSIPISLFPRGLLISLNCPRSFFRCVVSIFLNSVESSRSHHKSLTRTLYLHFWFDLPAMICIWSTSCFRKISVICSPIWQHYYGTAITFYN